MPKRDGDMAKGLTPHVCAPARKDEIAANSYLRRIGKGCEKTAITGGSLRFATASFIVVCHSGVRLGCLGFERAVH